MARLPRALGAADHAGRRWRSMLVGFWFLFQTGATWVSVAFYSGGLILGILLISQFWTLANDVYDPRQAKRLFGFIGGGARSAASPGRRSCVATPTRSARPTCCWSARTLMAVCAVLVVDRSSAASSRGRSRSPAAERGEGRQRGRGVRAAAQVEAPADHRAGDQLRRRRRGDHRAAAEHGGRRRQGRRQRPTRSRRSWRRSSCRRRSIGFVIQVWLTSGSTATSASGSRC